MLSEWRRIESFPDYSVSSSGLVRNDETGRFMAMLVNQSGIVNVGLTKNRVQYKRAVSLLVARAFLLKFRPYETFDCPINLDGDRYNNNADNLVWRPRWFATKYHQQFRDESYGSIFPIEDVDTQEFFETPWVAALKFGLLHRDILLSVRTQTYVWPIGRRFRQAQHSADIM